MKFPSWTLPAQQKSTEIVRPALLFKLTLLIGLLLTLVSAYLLHDQQQDFVHQKMSQEIEEASRKIQNRMGLYVYGLLGLRGALLAQQNAMDYQAFQRYSASRDIEREFPGMLGYGFIKRFPANLSTTQILADVEQLGIKNMNLRRFNDMNRERWIISMVTPEAANRPAIGLDVASEERRHRALVQAVSTGMATLTEPINLVQVDKSRMGFLLMLPVYASTTTPESLSERVRQVVGLTYAPLVADMVLGSSIPAVMGMSAAAYSHAGTLVPFFNTPSTRDGSNDLISKSLDLTILGQRWQLTFTVSPGMLINQQTLRPWHVLVIGILISILLAALIYSYALYRYQQVTEWTSKARLWQMLRNTSDAIIEVDSKNNITDWNLAGESLFGYTASMAIGQRLQDLLASQSNNQQMINLLNDVRMGLPVEHTRCELNRIDGVTLCVDVSAFSSDDKFESNRKIILLVHDVSREHRAELQIRQLNSNLEQEVTRRTEELQLAKRDLETIF